MLKTAKAYVVSITLGSLTFYVVAKFFRKCFGRRFVSATSVVDMVAATAEKRPFHIVNDEIYYELEIAKEHVPLVIGKNGSKISEILEMSRVADIRKIVDRERIFILIRSDSFIKCLHAKHLVERAFEALIECKVFVVKRLIGSLIGTGGENVKLLQRLTQTRIKIAESRHLKYETDLVSVEIRGIRDSVESAKQILHIWLQRIDEDAIRIREERNYDFCYKRLTNILPKYEEFSLEAATEAQVVYVSAQIDPGTFFVRKVSTNGSAEDKFQKFEREMDEFYRLEMNRVKHMMSRERLCNGLVVVVKSSITKVHYRARLTNVSEAKAIAFYLDYGDDEDVDVDNVFEIVPVFLEIPFQAIRCSLAHCAPANSDFWSIAASDHFEKITKCGTTQPIRLRVSKFPDKTAVSDYAVSLFEDSASDSDSTAKKMIDEGHAIGVDVLTNYRPQRNCIVDEFEESLVVEPDIHLSHFETDDSLVY